MWVWFWLYYVFMRKEGHIEDGATWRDANVYDKEERIRNNIFSVSINLLGISYNQLKSYRKLYRRLIKILLCMTINE